MQKKLVYHIYLGEDIETNVAYKVNMECLKTYIHLFDKVTFVIVMNDINDLELRKKGLEYVNTAECVKEMDIVFRPNTDIGEAASVRDYVVDFNSDPDSVVFFCHTKGITQFRGGDAKCRTESIFMWILTMYFYNLNFIEEVENYFLGRKVGIEAFYGALLMHLYEDDNFPKMIPEFHYSGSFYWFNKPYVSNLSREKKHIEDYVFNNRYDTEFLPGKIFKWNGMGGGRSSHNSVAIKLNKMLGAYYLLNLEGWDALIEILGDKEEFYKFKEKIEEKIGFKAEDLIQTTI